MQRYVKFLNAKNYTQEQLQQVEAWWVERVRAFFAGKPMVFRIDAAKSMRAAIRDLLAQAEKRQASASGATIVGTVLQHLVGAKLSLILPETLSMQGASFR